MSYFMTVRIQVGVEDCIRFSKKILKDTSVEEMRLIIREHQKIKPEHGLVLISNGKKLKNPDLTLTDHGICNDSLIICVISQEIGRDVELLSDDEEKKVEPEDVVLVCEFKERPFGFAVWANEKGENAIVTKVTGKHAINSGIRTGFCVYKLNDKLVYNKKHNYVLEELATISCPLHVSFLDLGREYVITFPSKPLGFTVVEDGDVKNAKVSKIDCERAANFGVKIGSHIVSVNDLDIFGMEHKQIIEIINKAGFPVKLGFRLLPQLQMVSIREKKKPLPAV